MCSAVVRLCGSSNEMAAWKQMPSFELKKPDHFDGAVAYILNFGKVISVYGGGGIDQHRSLWAGCKNQVRSVGSE